MILLMLDMLINASLVELVLEWNKKALFIII